MKINTHNVLIDFGKHKGMPWTRLPVSYLKWLSNEGTGEPKEYALAELDRRGTVTPDSLELSLHSINRASQITKEWKRQGVCKWLQRIAEEALDKANGDETVEYKGYKFSFSYGDYYPVLKTITKRGDWNDRD